MTIITDTPRFEFIEPNWKGLRLWAINGLETSRHGSKESCAFAEILGQCEAAKDAGRPDTDWED